MWNELVMVVSFDGTLVQMPSTEHREDVVYVKLHNGSYTLANKNEFEKSVRKDDKNKND